MNSVEISPQIRLFVAGQAAPVVSPGILSFAIVPSLAFGDGSHPTTGLIAGAVDLLCRQRAPAHFLDVGTGNGILARIARARGARFVVATDIDAVALESARANAALDGHALEIVVSKQAPNAWGACFELIAANILEGPLRELAPALAAALVQGGVLLLSGFTQIQIPALRVVYERVGLVVQSEAKRGEWALLVLARPHAPSAG